MGDGVEFVVAESVDRGRFELTVDGSVVSVAIYRREGSVVTVPHVETDARFRGQGMADRLMEGMLDQLRATGESIRPLCGWAHRYVLDHPEHHDLLVR